MQRITRVLVTSLLMFVDLGCDTTPKALNGNQPDFFVDLPDSVDLELGARNGQPPWVDRLAVVRSFAALSFAYVPTSTTDPHAWREYMERERGPQNLSRLILCESGIEQNVARCQAWNDGIKAWLLALARVGLPGITDVRQSADPVDFALQVGVTMHTFTSTYGLSRRQVPWTPQEVGEMEASSAGSMASSPRRTPCGRTCQPTA